MKKQVKIQENIINEIIKRYGETIDLKKSPYLIIEIIQQFQGKLNDNGIAAECAPPGGPPARGDDVILDSILKEMSKLSTSVEQLKNKISK